jgi:aspartyl/asparaginyl beta-hydroxylase (cupin superfamily)
MAQAQPWYNFFKLPFTGNEPCFFDVTDAGWKNKIEQNYSSIEPELLQFIKTNSNSLKEYRFIKNDQPTWQTFPLMSWGYVHKANIKLLPETWQLFSIIPEVVSVSISRLMPNKEIGAHHGDTNAIMRCHLGIIIPGTLPQCGFMVENESRNWQQGKLFAFCDARLHWAKNMTHNERYVMIIDVVRPEYMAQKSKVCATVIATHILYEVSKYTRLRKYSPPWLLKLLVHILIPFIKIYPGIKK